MVAGASCVTNAAGREATDDPRPVLGGGEPHQRGPDVTYRSALQVGDEVACVGALSLKASQESADGGPLRCAGQRGIDLLGPVPPTPLVGGVPVAIDGTLDELGDTPSERGGGTFGRQRALTECFGGEFCHGEATCFEAGQQEGEVGGGGIVGDALSEQSQLRNTESGDGWDQLLVEL